MFGGLVKETSLAAHFPYWGEGGKSWKNCQKKGSKKKRESKSVEGVKGGGGSSCVRAPSDTE